MEFVKKTAPQLNYFDDYLRLKTYVINTPVIKVNHKKTDLENLTAKAIDLFNTNAKSAFVFLAENGVNDGLPVDAANFIIDFAEYLSKTRLGEFLSRIEEYNQCVCAHLMNKYYFKRVKIEEAVRRLVKWIKLPQDAQQIDRILEKFGAAYYEQNFGVFRDSDTPYVLAFSMLMLNNELHNSAIPYNKKMTLQQFIESNTGIDAGADVPRELLNHIYGRIAAKEIQVEYDDDILNSKKSISTTNSATASASSIELFPISDNSGWLSVSTTSSSFILFTSWKQQWCCIKGGFLYQTNHKPNSSKVAVVEYYKIALDGIVITPDNDGLTFVVTSSRPDGELQVTRSPVKGKAVIVRKKKLSLRAANRSERDIWIAWLNGKASKSCIKTDDDAYIEEAARFALKNVLIEIKGTARSIESLTEAAAKLDIHLSSKNIKVKKLTVRNKKSDFSMTIRRNVGPALESIAEEEAPSENALGTLSEIPEPISEGWMRMKINESKWKRRYFVLLSDVDGGGTTLFYYVSPELAQVMISTGLQCQQGYLRMRKVTEVELKTIDGEKVVYMKATSEGNASSMTLVPELTDEEDIDITQLWYKMLQSSFGSKSRGK